MTRADEVWLAMTLGLVRNGEESLIHQFTMRVTLRCTATISVPRGFRQISSWSCEQTNYLEASLEMRKTRIMRHAQQTCFTQLISPLQPCSPTRRKKQRDKPKGRLVDGICQRTRRDNLNRHRSWRNLITLLDLCVSSPQCLRINRHITQQVTVVGIIWLSQHRHLNRISVWSVINFCETSNNFFVGAKMNCCIQRSTH